MKKPDYDLKADVARPPATDEEIAEALGLELPDLSPQAEGLAAEGGVSAEEREDYYQSGEGDR